MTARGFSLLEVLIAGVILFASISAASLVYTSATKSSQQASRAISFAAQVPLVVETIKTNLRQSSSSSQQYGEGPLLFGQYNWNATAEQVKRPIPILSVDSGQFQSPDIDIVLWKVNLTVTINEDQRQYSFYVTGWLS